MIDNEGGRRAGRGTLPLMDVWSISATPPDGGRYWLTEDMMPRDRQGNIKPVLRIAEVARIFFARSPDWLRLPDKNTRPLTLEGEPFSVERSSTGNRVFNLADVERLAHALLESQWISASQFFTTINILRWIAYNYKILSDEQMMPPVVESSVGDQLAIPGLHLPGEEAPEDEEASEEESEQAEPEAQEEGPCESCAAGEHAECAVTCEIALRTGGVVVPGMVLDAKCTCHAGGSSEHGA